MNKPYIVGLDLGGTTINCGLCDRSGKILHKEQLPTYAERGQAEVISRLKSAIDKVIAGSGVIWEEVAGIGMGIPGLLNSKEGICIHSPNFPDWHYVDVVSPIREEFGLPVYIINDVKSATLGEFYFGAGRGVENLLLITLGTGIGGGVVLHGELHLGPREGMCEIGHITIDESGPACGCGNRGCLEALAGRDAIIDRAIRFLQAGEPSILIELTGGDIKALTPALIVQAAQTGDKLSLQVLQETGKYIGIGLTNAICLYDPDLIIIGGGIAGAGSLIFEPIRRTVKARAQMVPFDPDKIVPAELGEDAGLIGATVLVAKAGC